MIDLSTLDRASLVQLTVRGRKTGKPYTVPVWFAVSNGKIYVTSGRGTKASWIKNLRANPHAELRIGTTSLRGTAAWRDDPGVATEILPLFYRKYLLARVLKWLAGWYKPPAFAFEITPTETA